ncbi:replication initiation factor domain-containing protein [Paracidovorax citrulli]|uniref:replication initiation factor domain-containing protein n=1 Tax=Paracidovorax citrulli TaxID=80869 RepID=UPI001D197969|nr:replication initiation factor domain-containing protein [Paracidovorax citrulli]UEG47435.1 replication initiation factor domain-containing protein [Paracidovorax citrulli]
MNSIVNPHAHRSTLVLDGNEVKVRLLAERTHSQTPVHVDWVRFTVLLRNAPLPKLDDLFPAQDVEPLSAYQLDQAADKLQRMRKLLRDLPDADFGASVQAKELGEQVCETLGPEFSVYPEVRKGHDFYRFRWSIVRNDVEVGWVGYLAAGDSPRQKGQAKSIHVNLYGSACTFARPGWNLDLANLMDYTGATMTRCDLALDFFDGLAGGMDRVRSDYREGLCNSAGKKLAINIVGDWENGRERSVYLGSKEAGKQTNVYEKGHQLFGKKDDSPWVRAELRYGNKLRELQTDMLRRPADFFAGASEWHAQLLREADAIPAPEKVPTTPRLAIETVEAEAVRNIRYAMDVAAPTLALCFQFLGEDAFLELVENQKRPGRLQRFSEAEIARAYRSAMTRISTGVDAGHVTA